MTADERKVDEAAEYYDSHDVAADIAAAHLNEHAPAESSAMAGYSIRLPKAVLREAREIARANGVSTGAWLRQVIEQAVVRSRGANSAELHDLLAQVTELTSALLGHDLSEGPRPSPGTLPAPARLRSVGSGKVARHHSTVAGGNTPTRRLSSTRRKRA